MCTVKWMEFIEFKHQAIMHIHSLLTMETSHYCIVYIYILGRLGLFFRPEIEASICVSNLKLSNLVKVKEVIGDMVDSGLKEDVADLITIFLVA